MASRCRSFSKPAVSMFKAAFNKPKSASSVLGLRPSLGPTRPIGQLGSLQSLLPLHSAVSSARLTSCLGIDSRNSRSLFQGMLSTNPGNLASVDLDKRDQNHDKKRNLILDEDSHLF